ncbi:lysine decarboxylase-like protein [Trypanosoma rangeli]|uniref:Lysine decarboxylase-like protein n=1 Tax=Trypanosoma rangeli TaxID=5698 RepID=A0A422MP54_TRYRA|nr:lysine decarboxylase-like protein [Trypanosoma rangeli]RNE95006.1 lysine decarboxylase-like protein [Trypanosoma rangeli]|eukprot:RNE95006.1 lysine decarboxylase-like protein [Trypanosoma rangeli]
MVYCVLFTATLREAAKEPAFLQAFRQMQQHCQEHEPGTLTYELCRDDENPLRFYVVERYMSREDFEEGHMSNATLTAFLAHLQEKDLAETSLVKMSSHGLPAQLHAIPANTNVLQVRPPVSDPPLRQQKGVLVFCGSSSGVRPSYTAEAEALGKYLAVNAKLPLVYGGGTKGLMGAVARATKQHGGKVIAVLPYALRPREAEGTLIGDVVYMTETMSERKSIMFAHSSAVVTLPGGMGTFDELLEVLTLLLINAHRTKIGFVNVDGYFEPLFACVRNMIQEGFVEAKCMDAFVVRPTAVELMQALESFQPPPTASLEWYVRP